MKGKFIVFEGIDGSGKGTVISAIKEFLLSKGVADGRIILTAEPTNSLYGKKVRELLKSSVNPDVNARQFLDLYVMDRKEHVEKQILPALRDGKIILCDRYKYSTFVYQSLQGIALDEIKDLHRKLPVPDIVFILDLPVEVALKRIASDPKRSRLEIFEREEFLERVRSGFVLLKKIFPKENIVVIDSSKNSREVATKVEGVLWGKIRV